jgi:DNA topoisomerase VI subunit A
LCCFLQGKGFPDVATRLLVRLLWKFLGVPVLVLVDADPHGVEIMCVYRFGSLVSLSEFLGESLKVFGCACVGSGGC